MPCYLRTQTLCTALYPSFAVCLDWWPCISLSLFLLWLCFWDVISRKKTWRLLEKWAAWRRVVLCRDVVVLALCCLVALFSSALRLYLRVVAVAHYSIAMIRLSLLSWFFRCLREHLWRCFHYLECASAANCPMESRYRNCLGIQLFRASGSQTLYVFCWNQEPIV